MQIGSRNRKNVFVFSHLISALFPYYHFRFLLFATSARRDLRKKREMSKLNFSKNLPLKNLETVFAVEAHELPADLTLAICASASLVRHTRSACLFCLESKQGYFKMLFHKSAKCMPATEKCKFGSIPIDVSSSSRGGASMKWMKSENRKRTIIGNLTREFSKQ